MRPFFVSDTVRKGKKANNPTNTKSQPTKPRKQDKEQESKPRKQDKGRTKGAKERTKEDKRGKRKAKGKDKRKDFVGVFDKRKGKTRNKPFIRLTIHAYKSPTINAKPQTHTNTHTTKESALKPSKNAK